MDFVQKVQIAQKHSLFIISCYLYQSPKLFFEFDKKILEDLKKTVIVCHFCKDIGHKSNRCTKRMFSNVDLFCENVKLFLNQSVNFI